MLQNIFKRPEVPDGIMTHKGEVIFPGLSNSFEIQNSRPWHEKYFLLIIFVILFLIPFLGSLKFFMKASPQDFLYSAETFDFGDISFARARKAATIEIDEIFGNLYVKDKKPEKEAKEGNSTGAEGSGDGFGEGVEDLAFSPGIRPPRPVGILKRFFPEIAKQAEVGATVIIEIIIDTNGIVRSAKPLYVTLNKALPKEKENSIKSAFANAAKKTLMGARFTVVKINGKVVPIKMELPLKFELL